MKSFSLCAAVIACAGIFGTPDTADALDISQTISLERYTVISDDTLQYDVGWMGSSGKFTTITSTEDIGHWLAAVDYHF